MSQATSARSENASPPPAQTACMTMTRMSEAGAATGVTPSPKPMELQHGSALARAVHAPGPAMRGQVLLLVMLSPMMSSGCVIPPSLEVDDEPIVNSPPAILTVISDQVALAEPGPVGFEQQTTDSLSITLLDTDLLDTLYVGIYVDYNQPDRLAARARCMAPPNADESRTVTCRLNSLCADADIGVQRGMTIVVFDRPPDDTGALSPPFQAMPEPGLSTSRFYFLNCLPAE